MLVPGGAGAPLRAAHLSAFPVHREVGGVEGSLLAGLPAQVRSRWSDQLDAVALARGDDVAAADIGRVDQVLGGGQTLGGQRVVDRLRAHRLVHVGRRRLGVHDQPRCFGVAGLGEVDHVPGPVRAVLRAEAGLGVVGALDAVAGAAPLRWAQPHAAGRLVAPAARGVIPRPCRDPLEVARPDAAQHADRRQLSHALGCVRAVHGIEQAKAVRAHLGRRGPRA